MRFFIFCCLLLRRLYHTPFSRPDLVVLDIRVGFTPSFFRRVRRDEQTFFLAVERFYSCFLFIFSFSSAALNRDPVTLLLCPAATSPPKARSILLKLLL
jgi:hypothetical protein